MTTKADCESASFCWRCNMRLTNVAAPKFTVTEVKASPARDADWTLEELPATTLDALSQPIRHDDESITPQPSQDADEDGWIRWDGGPCPLPDGVFVHLRLEGGTDDCNPLHFYEIDMSNRGAGNMTRAEAWEHRELCPQYNIIAYRLSKEQK